MRLCVKERTSTGVVVTATFPTPTTICGMYADTKDGLVSLTNLMASDGVESMPIDKNVLLDPGSYRLSGDIKSTDAAIVVVETEREPITNNDLSSLLLGLYDCMSCDASVALNYPVSQDNTKPNPDVVPLKDYKLVEQERNDLYRKLTEAEDHIEQITKLIYR